MARLSPTTTARLEIREFTLDDHAAVQTWATDPEVCRFMPWGPNSDQETTEYLQRCLGYQSDEPRRNHELCLAERESGQVIGGIGMRLDPDPARSQAEIGYVLRRDRWGQGLMAEATHGILALGFEHFALHRLWAATNPQNLASGRVLEKCGFRLEGCLREHLLIKGKRCSSLWYGLLASEWRAATPVS